MLISIITTIQPPTPSVRTLAETLASVECPLVVAGDAKGPAEFTQANTAFLSIDTQLQSPFALAKILPLNHYARKNIGYLKAIADGATCLYETDDDNAPLPSWAPRTLQISAHIVNECGWVNAYRCFTVERIWPRGFPLDAVVTSCEETPSLSSELTTVHAPIQQGLANNSPDVDAVWRLVLDRPFDFNEGPSIYLPPGAWCPFNSQSTWWWPEAYPLLYLPSYCSFRMTDIWRSFIAQRCLWDLGYGLVFHAPEVVQERNPHNLMRDFNDEIPGYQRNREMVEILEELPLKGGQEHVAANLRTCYKTLIARDFFPAKEMELVEAWLGDLEAVGRRTEDSRQRTADGRPQTEEP